MSCNLLELRLCINISAGCHCNYKKEHSLNSVHDVMIFSPIIVSCRGVGCIDGPDQDETSCHGNHTVARGNTTCEHRAEAGEVDRIHTGGATVSVRLSTDVCV